MTPLSSLQVYRPNIHHGKRGNGCPKNRLVRRRWILPTLCQVPMPCWGCPVWLCGHREVTLAVMYVSLQTWPPLLCWGPGGSSRTSGRTLLRSGVASPQASAANCRLNWAAGSSLLTWSTWLGGGLGATSMAAAISSHLCSSLMPLWRLWVRKEEKAQRMPNI